MNKNNPIIVNGEEVSVNHQEFKLVTDPNASFDEYG